MSKPVVHKPDNPFPLTLPDDVQPSDPRLEPTRQEIAKHPEGLVERIQRTRRYFRLLRKVQPTRYAEGLDSKPQDFA